MGYLKLLLFLFVLTKYALFGENLKSINVGIYQNKPKIFFDTQNKPMGYHIDILEEIAKNENLKLNYIPCKWSTCLKLLQNRKLDIMPDVGYSKKREEKFLFSKETLFSSWSYIYTRKDLDLKSLLDLEDKNIAVLKNSIQASHIQRKLKEFNVKPKKFIDVSNWKEGFVFLEEKKVDALLVNRFYELSNKINDGIIRTDIIVLPVMVKYGFSPNNQDLAQKIDKQIRVLKNDKTSVYYKAKEKWLTKEEENKTPKWLIISFIFTIVLVIALLFIVFLFNNLVKKKTKELLQKSKLYLCNQNWPQWEKCLKQLHISGGNHFQ